MAFALRSCTLAFALTSCTLAFDASLAAGPWARKSASRPGSHPRLCDAEHTEEPVTCHRMASAEASALTTFYRTHGYRASARSGEELYALKHGSTLVGAVRLIPKGQLRFLRNLFVAPQWRRRGLGTTLLRAATEEGPPCFCYALEELVPLYESVGFERTAPARVSRWMRQDFASVSRQQARKQQARKQQTLVLMTRGVQQAEDTDTERRAGEATRDRTSIVVLQHIKEQGRPTATARLLDHDSLAGHLRVEFWEWSGRKENAQLEAALEALPGPRRLLWTDGSASEEESREGPCKTERRTIPAAAGCTYIIIDGTWQEARTIMRKGPSALRALPRTTLQPGAPSTYTLRRNYGWRERFGALSEAGEDGLLCTAEAGACLLERGGDTTGADRVRELLAEFQGAYAALGASAAGRLADGPRGQRRDRRERAPVARLRACASDSELAAEYKRFDERLRQSRQAGQLWDGPAPRTSAALDPRQIIALTLNSLCQNGTPTAHSGTALLLRFAAPHFELAGIPAGVLTSPPDLTAAFETSQYGLLLQPPGAVAYDFPTDIFSLDDSTAWQEVLLIDARTQLVDAKLGWELVRDGETGCWLHHELVWHDFREKWRPGIGQEEWDRSFG